MQKHLLPLRVKMNLLVIYPEKTVIFNVKLYNFFLDLVFNF